MKNSIRKLMKKHTNLDVSYEKGMSYFRKITDSDKDIDKLYQETKTIYRSKLGNGTLNIKYEKLKIKERQGKLQGSGEDFQLNYCIAIFAAFLTVLVQSLFEEVKIMIPVVVIISLGTLVNELIKAVKPNRSINMTLAISLMVLEELEKEQDNKADFCRSMI